tara:strand:- start:62 stop:346 length:285 start_codon:yes stop_codon:yes gene_type:complete
MAYKQKPITFGEGTGLTDLTKTEEKGPKFHGQKEANPPMEGSGPFDPDMKDEVADNKPPRTKPPLFSDDAHDKVKKKGAPMCGCSHKGKKCGCK